MLPIFRRFKKFRQQPKITIKADKGRTIFISFRGISLVLTITLALLSVFLALRSDLFLVRNQNIKIEGSTLSKGFLDQSKIKDSLGEYSARSIFFIKESEVASKVSQVSPTIKEVRVSKIFPDNLEIRVLLRESVADVISDQGSFLIDDQGFAFAVAPSNITLPRFSLAAGQSLYLGQSLKPIFSNSALKVISLLQGVDAVKITNFDLDENGVVTLVTTDGATVYFMSGASISDQVKIFLAILSKASADKRKLVKADFRFERPIIVLQ